MVKREESQRGFKESRRLKSVEGKVKVVSRGGESRVRVGMQLMADRPVSGRCQAAGGFFFFFFGLFFSFTRGGGGPGAGQGSPEEQYGRVREGGGGEGTAKIWYPRPLSGWW